MSDFLISDFVSLFHWLSFFHNTIYNTIKDPHWYAVQGSDTTMLPIAASLFGQKALIAY